MQSLPLYSRWSVCLLQLPPVENWMKRICWSQYIPTHSSQAYTHAYQLLAFKITYNWCKPLNFQRSKQSCPPPYRRWENMCHVHKGGWGISLSGHWWEAQHSFTRNYLGEYNGNSPGVWTQSDAIYCSRTGFYSKLYIAISFIQFS